MGPSPPTGPNFEGYPGYEDSKGCKPLRGTHHMQMGYFRYEKMK